MIEAISSGMLQDDAFLILETHDFIYIVKMSIYWYW